jgi:hypothetical protein
METYPSELIVPHQEEANKRTAAIRCGLENLES